MTKIKATLNVIAIVFGMLLLQQYAFSDTKNITELVKIDSKVGSGEEAIGGHTVKVHYTGWLYKADAPQKKRGQI